MTDKKLLLLLKANPEKGLEKAIDLYGDTVKWICLKILGNSSAQDIEECISDIFVKLWKNVDNFNPSYNFTLKSYLCGISRYTAIDYKRKKNIAIEFINIEDNDLGIDLDFTDEIAIKENTSIIRETINSLPEPDRKIFILRYYFCYKVKDISEELNLPTKTIENKLYRGKSTLQKSLIERGIIL